MKADQRLTVARMVELGGVSRAGFYRFDQEAVARADPDMDLRDAIQRIALEWPSYGRPRITAELRRQGWEVNPKRVQRLMREDNLLCVRKRKFIATTDSNHDRKVYPNLAAQMEITGINQLWSPTSPIFGWRRSSCTWRWSSTRFRAGRLAGRWTERWKTSLPCRRCAWR